MKSYNLLISYQCPQCGAPAVLEETDRLFACEFCRVKSYLIEKEYFRYILPDNAPEGKTLLYIPYWRLKGVLYSSLLNEVDFRFSDISQVAISCERFPFSLGLRSQALKLKFVTPETPGKFIRPAFSIKDVIGNFEKTFNRGLTSKPFHQAFIGETLSMIYAPFYINDKLYDAVLNKAVSNIIPNEDDLAVQKPDWKINFIPAICPDCGWDLTGERNALALICKNCESIWQPGKQGGLTKVPYIFLPGNTDSMYLPFWRIRAEVSGIILNSYADFIKIANVPKVIRTGWDEIPFYFWVPAFKAPPQTFLRLCSSITGYQIHDEPETGSFENRMIGVTLSVTEAVESLILTIADFVKPKRKILPRLQHMSVTPKSYLLAYIPFDENPHEFVHPGFQMSVSKKMLEMGEKL